MSTSDLRLSSVPSAKAEMFIRRPAAEVFEAFVDPAITTQVWFTKSSGRLSPGAEVTWEWEMYNVSSTARVKEFEPERRLVVEWNSEEQPTTVAWDFDGRPDGTFVSITESGYTGDADAVTAGALASTEAFTMVLANVKALLEHKITLNLVADRFPDGIGEH
jgi:uncharacterized protein YndB with AHSA1/START domain